MNPLAILAFINAAFRVIKAFSALAIVVGAGVAGFIYSPVFRTFFLGIAVGAALLFGLEYSNFSFTTKKQGIACFNPKVDPNGCKRQHWVSTDDARGFGYWTCSD